MNRRTLIVLTGALAARTFIPTTESIANDGAPEQNWPQRTVKIILPFGPGSAADIAARIFADRLSPRWRRPVVVENRPSSDGLVAIAAFVSADDDHTLLYSSGAVFIPHPFVHEKLPYDAARDLIPIAGIADISIGIIVPQSLQVDSLAELEALARAQPGKLNWGAITSLDDFVFSGFLKNSGLAMSRVPYRDPVQALNDISEGRTRTIRQGQASCGSQPSAITDHPERPHGYRGTVSRTFLWSLWSHRGIVRTPYHVSRNT
jgi:tripartite-type tricarboxylate transporter receptor subunit TctC